MKAESNRLYSSWPRERTLLPLRGRIPAGTEMPFGSGGIAVAGVGEQAVERARVGAVDFNYLGAA